MITETKAQLRAEIERLNGVISYYRSEPYTIDYKVYLMLSDMIENNKSEILEDLNGWQLNNHAVYLLNKEYDLLNRAAECLAGMPKRADNGDLLKVDNGTPDGGYA